MKRKPFGTNPVLADLPSANLLDESIKSYPWYESVNSNGELKQGDILLEFPIFEPPDNYLDLLDKGESIESCVRFQDVIVMSQSCDLTTQANGKRKTDYVLLCQIYFKDHLESNYSEYRKKEFWETVRKGSKLDFHLLNDCNSEDNTCSFILVDFKRTYSVKFDILYEFAFRKKSRLRLLPPYREHLSQRFARFFMRVGLPSDIPSFL